VDDDETLKNTPDDCRRCHGGGPNRAGPILLMRELAAPWTHWIQDPSPLRDTYLAAKRDPRQPGSAVSEPYAGVMLTAVVSAGSLQELVASAERTGLQATQPLLFPSAEIGFETGERIFDGGPYRRPTNKTDDFARSPTWQALYDAFRAGEAPAPPYQHERVADDAKLRALATQYQAYLAGTLSKGDLPDLSDVLPDDAQRLAEAGFGVEPDASGPNLLLQACAACHNQTLDPSISRARFDVDLSRAGRTGIEGAVVRLELPADDPRRMPPAGFRSLTSEDRRRLVQYLQSVAP
jgi:mono/diheme cytochrome c family protein